MEHLIFISCLIVAVIFLAWIGYSSEESEKKRKFLIEKGFIQEPPVEDHLSKNVRENTELLRKAREEDIKEFKDLFLVELSPINRGEYFIYFLIIHAALVLSYFFPENIFVIIPCLMIIFYFTTMAGICRLNDIGWSPWLILVPFVYILILFIPTHSKEKSEVKKLKKKVEIAELKKRLKDLEE